MTDDYKLAFQLLVTNDYRNNSQIKTYCSSKKDTIKTNKQIDTIVRN